MKPHTAPMPGTLFVVATPIGNLDDITLRALRVLREATLIAAEDTRRTAHLLARHGITTPTTSLHEHNEHLKSAALVARLLAGDRIALVSDAGTPTISDPGSRFVRAAIEAGVKVEPIPGPNAAIAVLSVSGLLTDSFMFLGFPPIKAKDRNSWLQRMQRVGGVVIFYEAPHRIERTLKDVTALVGDRLAIVARELTKAHEELVMGPISTLFERLSAIKGEFTVVVDVGPPPSGVTNIGQLPDYSALNRRRLIADFAERVGVPANELYRAIETLKNLGHSTTRS